MGEHSVRKSCSYWLNILR